MSIDEKIRIKISSRLLYERISLGSTISDTDSQVLFIFVDVNAAHFIGFTTTAVFPKDSQIGGCGQPSLPRVSHFSV